jgi:NMD protein affecting ribosome stability and mRNA decay
MTILKKLFGGKEPQRVRICQECGMPVAEHKDWCSIFRTMQAMEKRKAEAHPSSPKVTPAPAPSES